MHQPKQMQWEPHDVLAEGLNLQAEMGDVQTSVCILTVLGERRNEIPIEKIIQVRHTPDKNHSRRRRVPVHRNGVHFVSTCRNTGSSPTLNSCTTINFGTKQQK